MEIFAKDFEIFTLGSDKLNRKINICKCFYRYPSKVHLPVALENSANVMPAMWFYSKSKKYSLKVL